MVRSAALQRRAFLRLVLAGAGGMPLLAACGSAASIGAGAPPTPVASSPVSSLAVSSVTSALLSTAVSAPTTSTTTATIAALPSPTPNAQAAPDKPVVAITYEAWPGGPSLAAQAAIIKDFNAQQSAVKVTEEIPASGASLYEKLEAEAAGNTLPDLSFMQGTYNYLAFVVNNLLLALDDLIKTDKSFDRASHIPARADAIVTILGKTWALPVESATWVMHYNKRLFDEAGIAYPKAGWTWDDLVTSATKLTKGGPSGQQYGFVGQSPSRYTAQNLQPFVEQNGGKYYDRDVFPKKQLFDSPEVIESYRFMDDLLWKYQAIPPSTTKESGATLFQTSKVAMLQDGVWQLPGFAQQLKDPHGIAPLPVKKRSADWLSIDVTVIFRSSKHADAAWQFLRFINDLQGQKRMLELWGRMPVLQADQSRTMFLDWTRQQGIDNGQIAWDVWQNGFLDALTPAGPQIDQALSPVIKRIFSQSGTDVTKELTAVAPVIQALLDKNGQPPTGL
ncbi:MAG: extracellular solute-binding protein [Chloroflexota bacterium]